MSRSFQKSPVLSVVICRSEKEDKKSWHRRWRVRVRTAMACEQYDDSDSRLPMSVRQVSNVRAMGKDDSRIWRTRCELKKLAERMARWRRPEAEQASSEMRFFRRFMGK